MLLNGLDAASAAFEVGYESATQFNREYSHLFWPTTMRDIRTLGWPGAFSTESVSNRSEPPYDVTYVTLESDGGHSQTPSPAVFLGRKEVAHASGSSDNENYAEEHFVRN
jgi:hypothetical protein